MTLGCVDETNGAVDWWDKGCEYYDANPRKCGVYNDADFKANSMCCACKTPGNFEMMKFTIYIYIYI